MCVTGVVPDLPSPRTLGLSTMVNPCSTTAIQQVGGLSSAVTLGYQAGALLSETILQSQCLPEGQYIGCPAWDRYQRLLVTRDR